MVSFYYSDWLLGDSSFLLLRRECSHFTSLRNLSLFFNTTMSTLTIDGFFSTLSSWFLISASAAKSFLFYFWCQNGKKWIFARMENSATTFRFCEKLRRWNREDDWNIPRSERVFILFYFKRLWNKTTSDDDDDDVTMFLCVFVLMRQVYCYKSAALKKLTTLFTFRKNRKAI